MFNHLADKIVPRAGVEPARVAPLVFETSASTDSAIWAFAYSLNWESGAKVGYFLMYANYFPPFLAEGSEIRIKLYGICVKKQNVLCWGMKD